MESPHKASVKASCILLVEDHQDARKTIQMMLNKIGISNILMASNGNEALLKYSQAGPKLSMILCDWNMPNMSGIDFLHHIRRANESLPFIMITARGDLLSIEEAKAAKVSGYILKPFTLEEIRKKILAFL